MYQHYWLDKHLVASKKLTALMLLVGWEWHPTCKKTHLLSRWQPVNQVSPWKRLLKWCLCV